MHGLIRAPRRPPGWRPIGPHPPADAAARPELLPRRGEDLCHLSGEWRILQRVDGHRWSLDDLVTAWMAADELAANPPSRIADLGCGIGSVVLMMAWRFPSARLVGVEAQEVSVDLARRSIAWNGADDRCEVRLGDLRDAAMLRAGERFDLVTGTPPYFPRGQGVESEKVQCAPCRFEHRGGVEAYIVAGARALAEGGRLILCGAAGEWDRVRAAADEVDLRVVDWLEVIPREGKAPLVAVWTLSRVGGAIGAARSLVVRDRSSAWTSDFARVRDDMGMPASPPR